VPRIQLDRHVGPDLGRRQTMAAGLGEPLTQALRKRRVRLTPDGRARVRNALRDADETEDAYDLFRELD